MTTRQLLLRIMLWALVVAAVIGATAVFLFRGEVAWRVIGTAIATAVAAGLAIPIFFLTERPAARWAGLLGLGAILVQYLLVSAAIWDLARPLFDVSEEMLALMIAWVFCCTPPGMLLLWATEKPWTKVAGWAGSALTLVVFMVLMMATLGSGGRFMPLDEKLAESAGVLALFGLMATVALVGAGTDRRNWRYVGVAAAAVGCSMAIVAIMLEMHETSRVFTVATLVAAVVAHANIIEMCPLPGPQRWAGQLTITAGVLTACLLDIVTIGRLDDMNNLWGRAAAAAAILTGCGTLGVGVLAAMNRKVKTAPVTFQGVKEFTLVCPACGLRQALPPGESRCAKCRLIIRTQFEEPRCPTCNYCLLMLTSQRCPECGTEIAATPPTDASTSPAGRG
jgi:hypothetical protein